MNDSPNIADVTRSDFAARVLERSHQVPVLVDFWAPWCGPCRMLGPVLEKLADEYAGKFFLAKVNTDDEQELAAQYHIRGIPAVKLFRNGDVASEFVGVQPESAVRELVDRFVANEVDGVIAEAQKAARNGKIQDATASLRAALAREPQNDKLKIALARCLLSEALSEPPLERRSGEAQKLLDSLSLRVGADPDVETLRARLELLRWAGDAPPDAALRKALERNADDHRARLQLGARLALRGEHETAMNHFLEIVRRNRKFDGDAGRRALLATFKWVGGRDPLVVQYRAVLARALN